MVDSEKYRANYRESLKTKLHIPRNAEGKPNHAIFMAARATSEILAEDAIPGFVGVVARGSRMLGFARSRSDNDLGILYDSSQAGFDQDNFERHGTRIRQIRKGFRENGLAVDPMAEDVAFLHRADALTSRLGLYDATQFRPLAMLCQPSVGEKSGSRISEYRNMLKEKLLLLSERSRNLILARIVMTALELERGRSVRMAQRMPHVAHESIYNDVHGPRVQLWKKKLEKILDLN